MLDFLKETFPSDALGPFVVGVLAWFGINFVFLAPSVIGPRLAERYYVPACVASVEQGRAARLQADKDEEQAVMAQLQRGVENAVRQSQQAVGGMLMQLFQGYGREGEAFIERHGQTLGNFSDRMGGQAAGPLAAQAQRAYAEWQAKKNAERAAQRAAQRFTAPAAFCGCNVSAALSSNVDLALFTSTLRAYKPKGISDIESGRVFEAECGKAPVV